MQQDILTLLTAHPAHTHGKCSGAKTEARASLCPGDGTSGRKMMCVDAVRDDCERGMDPQRAANVALVLRSAQHQIGPPGSNTFPCGSGPMQRWR